MIDEIVLLAAYIFVVVVDVLIRPMDNNLIVQHDLVQEQDDQLQKIRFPHDV
jgi:hypothetical protein